MSTGTRSGWYPGRCKDCAEPAVEGARCATCRLAHNARSAKRRAALLAAGQCTVCGGRAVRVAGALLTTCGVHREYYRVRAERGIRLPSSRRARGPRAR